MFLSVATEWLARWGGEDERGKREERRERGRRNTDHYYYRYVLPLQITNVNC
jgi:hypothetical protein